MARGVFGASSCRQTISKDYPSTSKEKPTISYPISLPDIVDLQEGRSNIEIRYRRFSYDIEGKNFDIVTVPDIVPDIAPDIVFILYINLTCHLEHAGPSLQRRGILVKNTSPSHTAMCQHSMSALWRNILGRLPLLPCYLKSNTVNTIPYSCRSQTCSCMTRKKRVQEKEGAGIQGKRSCNSSAPARGSSLKNGRARAMNVMDNGV
jgi:hypothetical protein